MAVTQYIGARYVPLFADPLDWDNQREYEPLTIVYYQGNSYTSRQAVPAGIDILNDAYWALTGNYNAQIEQYRTEVAAYNGRITENAQAIANEVSARMAADTELQSAITSETNNRETADDALQAAITAETVARETADDALQAAITAETVARETSTINLTRDIKSQHILGGYLSPEYVGSYMSNYQMSSCLRIGDNFYTFNPFNDGSGNVQMQRFSISGNNRVQDVTHAGGHANSVCYNKTKNQIMLAGLFNGTVASNVADSNVYLFDQTLTPIGTMQMPDNAPVLGISYDFITDTTYAISASSSYMNIYILRNDDNAFTNWKQLSYDTLKLSDDIESTLWQDLAVRDGIAFICTYDGTAFAIDLKENYDNEDVELITTFRVGSADAGYYWHFGEHEAWEFDETGNLYQARNGSINETNPGYIHPLNSCFVTSINSSVNTEAVHARSQILYATLDVNDANANMFICPRGNLQSINQLMWLQFKPSKLNVGSNQTLSETLVRIPTNIVLDITGNMTCSRINVLDGACVIRVRNTGKLSITRPSNESRNYAISTTDRPAPLYIRNEGTITYEGYTRLASSGVMPCVIGYTGAGIVNGSSTDIAINDLTDVKAGTLLMGAYRVYKYGA